MKNSIKQKLICIIAVLVLVLTVVPTDAKVVSGDERITASEMEYLPYPAQPGQYVHLMVRVKNIWTDDMKNVLFRISPEYPFSLDPGVSPDVKVRTFDKGNQRLLEWDLRVDSDAKEGTYEFDIQFCENYDCSVYYPIPVQMYVYPGGTPKMRAVIEDMPKFESGERGTVTLNIINRGELSIKYLIVTLQKSSNYEILSPKEIYVGALTSDDFDTVDYELFINEISGGLLGSEEIELPVLLEYSDINNKEYHETLKVGLPVHSGIAAWRMGLKSVGAGWKFLFVLILAGVGYYIYRKRKKKRAR